MASYVCSDFSPSPRISFSHDLQESDINLVFVEHSHPISDKFLIDFNFSFNHSSSSPAISPADELFSNGKIRPGEIKKLPPTIQKNSRKTNKNSIPIISKKANENTIENTQKKTLKDFMTSSDEDNEEGEDEGKEPPARQFWQFRSNSTGSAPHPKTIVPQKMIGRSISKKEQKSMPRSASVSSSTQYYAFNSGKKASLRKSYSNVIRINPVLNITPTYFTKGLNPKPKDFTIPDTRILRGCKSGAQLSRARGYPLYLIRVASLPPGIFEPAPDWGRNYGTTLLVTALDPGVAL